MGDESEAPRPDTPTRTSAPRPDGDTRSAPTVDASGATVDASGATVDASGETVATPAALALSAAPRVAFPTVRPDVYVVGAELGRGGMGRVVSAYDTRLDRPVAIKELLVRSEALELRFAREARITAKLQHPAIVPVHEAGQWPDGSRFYTMKLIDGQPLDQLVSATRALADRLALVPKLATVCEALAYAHNQRIIHRDLKPSNILVGEFGETLVVDWGIAKELDSTAPDDVDEAARTVRLGGDATAIGSVLGTPAYMPPEQALGEPVDERADVYSLGAVLYSLLTRRLPYHASSSEGVLAEVVAGPPPSIASLEPDAPPDLVAIVEKAMHRDRTSRYANGAALAADLQRYLTGQLVGSHRYTFGQLARRWAGKHRAALAVSVVAFFLLCVVGAFAISRIVDARDAANESARIAARERDAAAENNAKLLFESARREFVNGDVERAAAYLAAAYHPQSSRSAQVLVGAVMEELSRTQTWNPPDGAYKVQFGSGSERLVVTDHAGRLHVYSTRSGAEESTPWAGLENVYRISLNGDFVLNRTGKTGESQIWSHQGFADITKQTSHPYTRIAIARTGHRVVATASRSLLVWTRGAGTVEVPLDLVGCPRPVDVFESIACDANCDTAFVGMDGCVVSVDLATLKQTFVGGGERSFLAGSTSADGTRSLFVTQGGREIVSGGPGAYATVAVPEMNHSPSLTKLTSEATHALWSRDHSFTLLSAGGRVEIVDVGERILSVDTDSTGSLVVATTANGYAVAYRMHPVRPARRLERIRAEGPIAVAPDGSAYVVGDIIRRPPSDLLFPMWPPVSSPVHLVTNDLRVDELGPTTGFWDYRFLDISDDGARGLDCSGEECEEHVVHERSTSRELYRLKRPQIANARAWLSRDHLVLATEDGNLMMPLSGGPPVMVRACAASKKAEWWMSEDSSHVVCVCRKHESCSAGPRLVAVELSNPNSVAKTIATSAQIREPCEAEQIWLRATHGDYVEVHECSHLTSILDRTGNFVCEGIRAVVGDDGRCYAIQKGRYLDPGAIEVSTPSVVPGRPQMVFGENVWSVEVRGELLYAHIRARDTEPSAIEVWDTVGGQLLWHRDVADMLREGFGVSVDGRRVIAALEKRVDDFGRGNVSRLVLAVPFEQRAREYVKPFLEARTRWTVVGSNLQRKVDGEQ